MGNNLNKFKNAYENEFKFNDENHSMLDWYSSKIISSVKNKNNISCLSLGIGHRTVSKKIIEELNPLNKYVIVEGSLDIIKRYKNEIEMKSYVEIIHCFFEKFHCNELFDFIEAGFILEHVDDPLLILKKFKRFLKSDGSMFIAVPNARSLHRLIGNKAGLLKNVYNLSEYDYQLGHKRYFDLNKITNLIINAGMKVKQCEGIFLKPLTTDQLKNINFSKEIYRALYMLAEDFPDISNSIFIEAELDA